MFKTMEFVMPNRLFDEAIAHRSLWIGTSGASSREVGPWGGGGKRGRPPPGAPPMARACWSVARYFSYSLLCIRNLASSAGLGKRPSEEAGLGGR